MTQDQLVSITDLRKNTSKIFKSLIKWPRFILANNKMEAVILSPNEYQRIKDVMRAKEWKKESEEALRNGKRYTKDNIHELIPDLLADD